QRHAEELFVSLVQIGQGATDSRRPALLRDLRPELARVAELLSGREARLLSIDGEKLEIAHEALLREWSRLRGWLQTQRKDLLLRQNLETRAQHWEEMAGGDASRADEGLLDPGWPLEEAQQLARGKPHLLSELCKRYIKASADNAQAIAAKQ